MVYFSNQKSNLGYILKGLGMKIVIIFFDHLEYFTAIWYSVNVRQRGAFSFGSFGMFFPVLVCEPIKI
jgi:hypothetical protein